ncbi:hypothetical protein LG290_16620 (plasmid) [Halomonas sediminis]
MKHVHHYTEASERLPKILSSGELLGRADNHDERPLVWFSSHPFWEPTATKPRKVGSMIVSQTFEEYRDGYGLVRFSLPANDSRLINWRKACKYAGISKRDRQAMETAGKKAGGNPSQWFALAGPLPLDQVYIEYLNGNSWEPAQ